MTVFRNIFLPFFAVVEILLLILNWIVAVISPRLGNKFMEWNMKFLPNKEWYNGNLKDRNVK